MHNPISARLRRWTPSDDGLHLIAADEIDRLARELDTVNKPESETSNG